MTPDRTLLGTDDSSLWLSTCDDPSPMVLSPGRTSCVDHHADGADVVYTYRSIGRDADCTATIDTIDYEVVVRNGTVRRWALHLTTEFGESDDSSTFAAPVDLDDPWPWQVVPGWFVNLAT